MEDVASKVLTSVAGEALRDVDGLSQRLIETIVARVPELARDARIGDLLALTVADNAVSALRILVSPSHDMPAVAPPVALEFARRLAQQGISLTAMLRAYRLGQGAFQQEMISRLEAENLTASELAAAARELSAVAFTFIDQISEEVVAAYQAERDTWLRGRNAARLSRVIDVLDERVADVEIAQKGLGYHLTGSHVGVVLWCAPGIDERDRLGTLEQVVPKVSSALGTGSGALSVAPDASTVWLWIASSRVDVDAACHALRDSPEVCAALGEPGVGLNGFRATHNQARRAQTIALAAVPHARQVTAAVQLGPLTLLSCDVASAGSWVRSVLGALATDDEQHARLRDTAWAYLSSGGSLNAAAAELHLHKNTIQYRIGKAEEARGRPFGDGRLDVEVALLACKVLGSAVLQHARTEPKAELGSKTS